MIDIYAFLSNQILYPFSSFYRQIRLPLVSYRRPDPSFLSLADSSFSSCQVSLWPSPQNHHSFFRFTFSVISLGKLLHQTSRWIKFILLQSLKAIYIYEGKCVVYVCIYIYTLIHNLFVYNIFMIHLQTSCISMKIFTKCMQARNLKVTRKLFQSELQLLYISSKITQNE